MISEIIFTAAGLILLTAGFIGCVIPVLPGPPLAFLSLILLSIPAGFSLFRPAVLIIIGAAAAASLIMDNILPVVSSGKAGAGKAGITGSIIGMIAGMFFPPLGVIIGAFTGAFIFELLFNRENEHPLKAAIGVLTGTLLGILLKLAVCGVITVFFIRGIKLIFQQA